MLGRVWVWVQTWQTEPHLTVWPHGNFDQRPCSGSRQGSCLDPTPAQVHPRARRAPPEPTAARVVSGAVVFLAAKGQGPTESGVSNA